MTNIGKIIAKYRTQMQDAGLLRQVAAAKLSKKVAEMRPSLLQAKLALQERQLVVQPSPMAILFEVTLPKIEHVLIEAGEERAEQIVGRLCEHGQEMIEQHKDEAKEYLEELFKDLPDYEVKLMEEEGVEGIIEAYRESYFEGRHEGYLRLKLGDKIEELKINEAGEIISLKMTSSADNSDLICLQRVNSLQELNLRGTQVSDVAPLSRLTGLLEVGIGGTEVTDFTPLRSLTSLRKLDIPGTQIIDLTPLSVLTNLCWLNLGATRISDITPLSSLTSLQWLYLHGTLVSDLTPLSKITRLQELYLFETQVSDTQVETLKRAIPGLVVYK